MDCDSIRIDKITVNSLYDFACRSYNAKAGNGMIPLGKQRAMAHTMNPCADEDDIGLLVAYQGLQCIGYLGIMPGLLRAGEQVSKVYWLSTWFVPPEFRNTSVGLTLIMHALSLKYDLVVCGMSDGAEKVYRGLRFKELGPLTYYQLRLDFIAPLNFFLRITRKIAKMLGIQFDISNSVARISRHIDSVFIALFYRVFQYSQKRQTKTLSCKPLFELSRKLKDLDDALPAAQFYRDAQVINWMLKYKWVIEEQKLEAPDRNYFFSEIRDTFQFVALKVYSSDRITYRGFLVFSISIGNLNSVLKILDYHFQRREDHRHIALLAMKYARKFKATRIEMPEDLISSFKDMPLIKLCLRKKSRIYLFRPKNKNSPLATASDRIHLNYCDGDTPFT